MEETDKVIAGILDRLQELVVTQAPEAVELAGRIYQLEAMSTLIMGVGIIVITIIMALVTKGIHSKGKKEKYADPWGGLLATSGFLLVIGMLASATQIVANLMSPLLWAQALDPKIALASEILSRL